jgi:hypothetical protein
MDLEGANTGAGNDRYRLYQITRTLPRGNCGFRELGEPTDFGVERRCPILTRSVSEDSGRKALGDFLANASG